jgi:hypothetical protein
MLTRRTMRWVWTGLALANLVLFAVFEGYALTHADALTLSRYLWEINQAWPPFGVILGMLWGGLVVHLFWHWLPDKNEKPDGG